MNTLENELKILLNNNDDFNIILSSILHNKNKTCYEKLLSCKKFSDYELTVLDKVNTHIRQINRIPALATCISENIVPRIDIEKLYIDNDILRDKLDLFLKEREKQFSSQSLHQLATHISKSGIPRNATDIVAKALSQSKNIYYSSGVNEFPEEYKNKDLALGFKTGVTEIDKRTGGLHLGTLNVIMGYAGSGKTTWAVNIAYNAARQNCNIAYISLEISKHNLIADLLSRHSNEPKFRGKTIEHRKIKHSELTKEEEDFLLNSVYKSFKEKIAEHFCIIDESDILEYSTTSFINILEEINNRFKKSTGKGIDLIFVDHIQLLKSSSSLNIRDTREIINTFVSFFRQQSVSFLDTKRPVCIVLLSQTNRDGWKYAAKHEGNYQLNALAEANELERDANVVLSIFTDEILINTNQALVKICKSRDTGAMEEAISTDIFAKTYMLGDYSTDVSQDMASITFDDVFQPTFDNPVLDSMANGSSLNNPFGDLSELDALLEN